VTRDIFGRQSNREGDPVSAHGEDVDPKPRPYSTFQIQVVASAETHTLLLSGESDLASGPELETVVRRLCDSGTSDLVLDLRDLEFIDSTGLRAILIAADLCDANGRGFRLIRVPESIRRVFEVSGVDGVLPIVEE
jgi:anti-anti-sigma factor